MNIRPDTLLRWSPRILSILVCLFLSVFALDALGNGRTLGEAFPDFALHVAPMLVLLAIASFAWRWEWVGGLVFTVLAVGYAFFARSHVSWVLCISIPFLIVGLLFFWSWLHRRESSASA